MPKSCFANSRRHRSAYAPGLGRTIHYRPILLETFVQLDRFTGTCYKAANWIRLGTTDGYSLYGKKQKEQMPTKAVFVYPLVKRFRENLCRAGG